MVRWARGCLAALVGAALMAVPMAPVEAANDGNYTFDTRQFVGDALPLTFSGTTVGAPGPAWFEWEAPIDAIVDVDIDGFGASASVFEGDAEDSLALASRLFADDYGDFGTSFGARAGQRYIFRVTADVCGDDVPCRGTGRGFGVELSFVAESVSNDALATAIELAGPLPVVGRAEPGAGALRPGEPRAGWLILRGQRSDWWSWTAETAEPIVVDSVGPHTVWRGPGPDELRPLPEEWLVDLPTRHPAVPFDYVARTELTPEVGETIYVQSDAELVRVARPDQLRAENDDVDDAVDLGGDLPIAAELILDAGTLEPFELPAVDDRTSSQWYRFRAPADQTIRLVIDGPVPAGLRLYGGSAGDLQALTQGGRSYAYARPGPERDIYLSVTNRPVPLVPLDLTVEVIEPPSNDDISAAAPMDLAARPVSIEGTLDDATSDPADPIAAASTRWWVWTPEETSQVRFTPVGRSSRAAAFLGSGLMPVSGLITVPAGEPFYVMVYGDIDDTRPTRVSVSPAQTGAGTEEDPFRLFEVPLDIDLPTGRSAWIELPPVPDGRDSTVYSVEALPGAAGSQISGEAVRRLPDGTVDRTDVWTLERSAVHAAARPGTTTLVRIDIDGVCTDCSVRVSDRGEQAPNDDRMAPSVILDDLPLEVTTSGRGTIEQDEPQPGDPGAVETFWWSWTAPVSDEVRVTTSALSIVGTEVTPGGVDDAAFDHMFRAIAGTTYVIQTWGPGPVRIETTEPVTCGGRPPTILGTAGDDVIVGTVGSDVIVAFGGDDMIRGLRGDDVICGGDGDDTIDAGGGDDIARAGAGNDRIRAGAGRDRVFGGSGDDRIEAHPRVAIVDGGTGQDWITFPEVIVGVTVDLRLGNVTDEFGSTAGIVRIENVEGTRWKDVLLGDDGNNVFAGLAAGDRIDGRGGNDVIIVEGWDIVDGGDGADTLRFGIDRGVVVDLERGRAMQGTTQVTVEGIERVDGTSHPDALLGTAGSEVLRGRGGDDEIHGRGGSDRLRGGAGTDRCDRDAADERRVSCELVQP